MPKHELGSFRISSLMQNEFRLRVYDGEGLHLCATAQSAKKEESDDHQPSQKFSPWQYSR